MKLLSYLQAWGDSLFKRNKAVIVQQLGFDYNRNIAIRNDVISTEHLLERLAYQLKKGKPYQLSPDTKLKGEVPVSLFPPLAQPNLAIQGGAL